MVSMISMAICAESVWLTDAENAENAGLFLCGMDTRDMRNGLPLF